MRFDRLLNLSRMSHGEYRANIEGMNIFFGAVLGIVLGGTEQMPPLKFAVLLAMSAGTVISILYMSSSKHRFAYMALTAFIIAFLPVLLEDLLGPGSMPNHLQPTLAVWAIMVAAVELTPREATPTPDAGSTSS